ncbi:DUF294 nucleotidyltransferase-like domain-containing protein [Pontibaca salina]|uniref:CBS domain-containing protein n=1 Tax=Pontibaca salina TaxID=2795731 RepID=A0A934HQZ9_9RHOB|nr:DUF294 nucleotidyltransferase-like domain-containing protein [Pontibaca salina]MBI6629030.1 CBS domain-containing protein [Pontibaca salina]
MEQTSQFLASIHPYNTLSQGELAQVAGAFARREWQTGETIYRYGAPLDGIYLIESGTVVITDQNEAQVSVLGRTNSFGERGLLRDGHAATTARMAEAGCLLLLPSQELNRLIRKSRSFARFFTRGPSSDGARPYADIATLRVTDFLTGIARTCAPDTPIAEAARMMREAHVSSLGITRDDSLVGLVTIRDMSNRVVAEGVDASRPVSEIMTKDPITLAPDALGTDVLTIMLERRIGHLPVVDRGAFAGMVTQTDLMRIQAISSPVLMRDIGGADTVEQLVSATARIPELLVNLVASGQRHEVITRLITDIADAVTRRLLAMAEDRLGPPPGRYLWAACGSQGRQEQTGISDQDNCLILGDEVPADSTYFADLAQFVSDGLNACGYIYCPGDMMAINPRWRQPRRVWQRYFQGWIDQPSPEAQMLASVMFDLRGIGGDHALLEGLQTATLELASKNTIFVAHMIGNSLKHRPPLGLIRGFATIRTGEHRNHIDMKLNGVVPVTDLARIYALQGRLPPVNTRARLQAAEAAGVLSPSGAGDLIAAFDLIQTTRLDNQARKIREDGAATNFLSPADLPDFERSHLRDAFVVVRTMQSALGHGKGALG